MNQYPLTSRTKVAGATTTTGGRVAAHTSLAGKHKQEKIINLNIQNCTLYLSNIFEFIMKIINVIVQKVLFV